MHMIHGLCGIDISYVSCMVGSTCIKHFPKCFFAETIIEENNFVKYKCRDDGRSVTIDAKSVDNRCVIP